MRCNFITFILIFSMPASAFAGIVLPGDEITLPPLLAEIGINSGTPEDRLNVSGTNQRKRQAKSGEWLDFGDSLDLPGRISAKIIQKENFMWVGGGVLQAKIGLGAVVKNDLIYELNLHRGWMKVWIKKDADQPMVRIHTAHGTFEAQEAEFWISSRPTQTEIYLISGELEAQPVQFKLSHSSYAVFEKASDKPRYLSKDWDPSLLEVKIAAAYSGLVRLAAQAQKEWEAGKSAQLYASFRKKGWRKAARLDPIAK